MSGMTDNNEFDSIADGMRNDVSEIREMLIHNHDLTAEIRRLREENEKIRERCDHWSNRAIEINEEKGRLEKQLSGIGAEQYYTMRQKYWAVCKENKRLEDRNVELEKQIDQIVDHHVDKELDLERQLKAEEDRYFRCANDSQKIHAMYWDLKKQNAELAEVLRLTVNNLESVLLSHDGLVSNLGKLYTILDQSREVLRKYGLEK